MTDTQFQVGLVYATRGGDLVRVTEIRQTHEPILGQFLTGSGAGGWNTWEANGTFRFPGTGRDDLLPGALPSPLPDADDKAELLALVRECGAQFRYYEGQHRAKGTTEADAKANVNADFAARCEAAIAKAERTS